MNASSPIFIVGTNRSGTTLLRLMLNAHSRIAIPEEATYFQSQYDGVPTEQWRAPALSSAAYRALVEDFVTSTAAIHPELDAPALIDRILNDGPHDLRRPYQLTLEAWARTTGKARWGEKTPGNLFYVDVLQEMFPDAYFLYVVRDPRAGVASMMNAPFFADDVVFNAMSRQKHAEVGLRLLQTHVAPDHWMTIRYEDLTNRPEDTLLGICALIGEDYEPAMLQYHRTAATYMKEEAASSFNATATRPVTTARIDAWRDQLSARDVAVIEAICADEMARYGYSPTSPALSIDAHLELGLKKAYWGLQMLRNRHIREYTVKHPVFARLRHRYSESVPALRLPRRIADTIPSSLPTALPAAALESVRDFTASLSWTPSFFRRTEPTRQKSVSSRSEDPDRQPASV